ncbi:MAG: ATP-binding protein [Candidatus Cryosericum sp.]
MNIAVASGKGGTGKTTVAASFAALARNKVVVDCDVDAADLYILLKPTVLEQHPFVGSKVAVIDNQRCTQCGTCIQVCRFGAIAADFVVDPASCEGCGLCSRICPVHAITMEDKQSGEWFISNTTYGSFVHATLGIAEKNSGKLVSLLRQQAQAIAERGQHDTIIIDGSPGIGCAVIASITGADLVLIVTEPTLSGLHDMLRVIELARHFHTKIAVAVNKYDLNTEMTRQIEDYCLEHYVAMAGRIAYDPVVTEAMVARQTVVEYSHGEVALQISTLWEKVMQQC